MNEEDEERLDRVAEELRAADRAVALTGAGVSTPSGIPSFRGEGGIWHEHFDPEDFRIRRFERDPADFWRDRLDLHDAMYPEDVEPNAAHEALAHLEQAGHLDAVVTQNTDGLHIEAGTEEVVELHGNAHRVVCRNCARRTDAALVRKRARDGELPPRCAECDDAFKPDVVLFGEMLPQDALERARHLATESDVFLAVGSSLTVDPAASLPGLTDGTLALVNLDETRYSDRAEYEFRADVTDVLPALTERVCG